MRTLIGLIIGLSLLTSCGIEPDPNKIKRRKHKLQGEGDAIPADKDDKGKGSNVDSADANNSDAKPNNPSTPNNPVNPSEPEEPVVPEVEMGEWHSLFFTGDNSIWAFDNAREELSAMAINAGFREENMIQLTKMSSIINQGMDEASKLNIRDALNRMDPVDDDLCFVHMTSHGSQSAFYLVGEAGMTPGQFDDMLNQKCGDKLTVVMISACYSGIFSASQKMRRPNRIIFTAARKDRTSFGCSPENEYTYWDGCLIDHLPTSSSWQSLYNNVDQCIEKKESRGGFKRSYPQLFIGEDAKNIPYPFDD